MYNNNNQSNIELYMQVKISGDLVHVGQHVF